MASTMPTMRVAPYLANAFTGDSNSKPTLPILTPDHGNSKVRTSLISNASSSSSESLVSALASFPATPKAPVRSLPNNSTQAANDEAQRSRSCSGSSTGSEDTLVPGSPETRSMYVLNSPRSRPSSGDLDCLGIDPLLTSAKDSPGFDQHSEKIEGKRSNHMDELGNPVAERNAGDTDTFDAIFSCLNIDKHLRPSSAKIASLTPHSPARLRSLTHDFEYCLSQFRSTAELLAEEINTQRDGGQSKLEELVLTTVRRAEAQAMEAMAMISWFRETKLKQLPSARLSSAIQAQRPALPNPASIESVAREVDGPHCHVKKVDAANKPLTRIDEFTRRNGFEAAGRDVAVTASPLAHHYRKNIRPHTAQAALLSANVSIEDLAKARSSTPLHFNRPASPLAPSQRRWGRRPATASKIVATDVRPIGRSPKPRGRSISTTDKNRAAIEAQVNSLRRMPSPHVNKAQSESEIRELVQFPSAGPSPPSSPDLISVSSEALSGVRQPKQSLKSIRNFKISLRTAYKDSAPQVDVPSIKITSEQCDSHSHPSSSMQAPTQRSVSEPLTISSNIKSSYVRALVAVNQRPLSIIAANGMINGTSKVAADIASVPPFISTNGLQDKQKESDGRSKLSLRSFWRVLSG